MDHTLGGIVSLLSVQYPDRKIATDNGKDGGDLVGKAKGAKISHGQKWRFMPEDPHNELFKICSSDMPSTQWVMATGETPKVPVPFTSVAVSHQGNKYRIMTADSALCWTMLGDGENETAEWMMIELEAILGPVRAEPESKAALSDGASSVTKTIDVQITRVNSLGHPNNLRYARLETEKGHKDVKTEQSKGTSEAFKEGGERKQDTGHKNEDSFEDSIEQETRSREKTAESDTETAIAVDSAETVNEDLRRCISAPNSRRTRGCWVTHGYVSRHGRSEVRNAQLGRAVSRPWAGQFLVSRCWGQGTL
ncbi:hypothetical protein CONPUDRAFT_76999 [Coniophora puteana RWD-64-598 SS2]|uniref:Uncharacterized protein n=1 Tax=Coniophora puteana (strain RWD-64-598) TaxID=741705 RepID=A0A5M3M9P5_CONPW|nr:uncharacterized protein CONPUDRAFT_76999 [Coniophora puteana RWD-64-598 SS2]EIW75968.1 hypothetical protein CONPUDRAFT_76999 [Coniophora puteana RWD-64-598 SS2]